MPAEVRGLLNVRHVLGPLDRSANNRFVLVPERHDALYVVGSLDETLELRGMRYHPIDIETSVIRSHKSIAEW